MTEAFDNPVLNSAEQRDVLHELAMLLGVAVRVSEAACSDAMERKERTDDRSLEGKRGNVDSVLLPLFLCFLPSYLFTCAAFEWTWLARTSRRLPYRWGDTLFRRASQTGSEYAHDLQGEVRHLLHEQDKLLFINR